MKENVILLIPKGEIEKITLNTMSDAGLEFAFSEKNYRTDVTNYPITFIRARASSIPTLLSREGSKAQAGITGSDILWQEGLGKDYGTEIPIFEMYPEEIQPRLYFGVNQNAETSKNPQDMSGKVVYSKFDSIAQAYFTERGITDVKVVYEAGGIEAMQYIFDIAGIIDVWATGRTAIANNIEPIDFFYDVVLKLIAREDLSKEKAGILDDLLEMIMVLKNKKQNLGTQYL